MTWTAVVPLKLAADRKSRLSSLIDAAGRRAISEAMVAHVIATLRSAPFVKRVIVLAPEPFGGCEWAIDLGRGLNAELAAWYTGSIRTPSIVVHADLPLLSVDDLALLTGRAALSGVAIAADRRGRGSNALALADGRPFAFAFGADSLSAHRSVRPDAQVLHDVTGLGLDIDVADDLVAAAALGWDYRRFLPSDR